MVHPLRSLLAACLVLLLPTAAAAQQAPDKPFEAERALIESVLGTAVTILRDAALQEDTGTISARLREMAARLNHLAPSSTAASGLADAPLRLAPAEPSAAVDLRELERLLRDLQAELIALRRSLEDAQSYDLANRLAPVERGLAEAVRMADDLTRAQARQAAPSMAERRRDAERRREADEREREAAEREAERRTERRQGERRGEWLPPGRYGEDDEHDGHARDDEHEEHADWHERADREDRRDREDGKDREERNRWQDDATPGFHYADVGTFLGEFPHRWPYHETAVYRSIPALRYNRVEGFVLGVGLRPLGWDDYERSRLYGQLGYAFALEAWRYEIGVETRPVRTRDDDYAFKLGGAYRRNTATNDLWKSNWLENSLAAFLFENDFFDYYAVQGWTIYAVQRFTPYVQASAGFRSEEHSTLARHTSWSLFDGAGFRYNPPIREGLMRSFVFAVEGGRVADLLGLPRGGAFRAEAELGHGLGSDFAFNRFEGDARVYLPLSAYSSLGLRVRGGLATGDVPYQKAFTLGGVGSIRAYPQNVFFGTRMLLGNAELVIDDVSLLGDLLEDLHLIGFADAGWVNGGRADRFRTDDLLPAAGLGIGLDERAVRLELAWPLRDLGDGYSPSLWLRLSPTF